MRKHQLLFPSLMPKHFNIQPKECFVKLNEELSENLYYADARLVGELNTTENDKIEYKELTFNFRNDGGVVKINDEYIKYEGLDRERIFDNDGNLLETKQYIKNLTRGYLNSKIQHHHDQILFKCRLLENINAGTSNISFFGLIGTPPDKGGFYIDDEYIKYTHFKQFEDGMTFYNCLRGSGGTFPNSHTKNSFIWESEGCIIDDVPIIKYDKLLFNCELVSDIDSDSNEIRFRKFNGGEFEQSLNGEIKIDNEYIRYESIQFPDNGDTTQGIFKSLKEYESTGSYYQRETEKVIKPLLRGLKGSKKTTHTYKSFTGRAYNNINLTDTTIILSNLSGQKPKLQGKFYLSKEFIDENNQPFEQEECIIYEGYTVNYKLGIYTFMNCERGAENSYQNSYDITHPIYGRTEIIEHRIVDLKKEGIIKIGREYISYWNIDDEYIYITKRGLRYGSLPEAHSIGNYIVEFFDENVNQNWKHFSQNFTEHLDYAIETPAKGFSNLNDVDNVEDEYLPLLVKTIGENLADYSWLEMDFRIFAKELTGIYKYKGLEYSIKMWKKLIDPNSYTSEIDLWTFNYWNFFSLILLVLLLYIPYDERNWTLMDFYLPQISDPVYKELTDVVKGSLNLYGYPVNDFELVIKEWYYLNKYDDEKPADSGFKFDDKIAPKQPFNNDPIEDQKIVLRHKDGTEYSLNDTYCADCHLPFYRSERELEGTGAKALLVKSIDDDDETIIIDAKIQLPLTWQDTTEYIIGDVVVPATLDGNKYVCIISGVSGGSQPWFHDFPGEETIDGTVRWRCEPGEYVTFYNPYDYIGKWDNPFGIPLGFAKIEDEIFYYKEIIFNEIDNTYTLKHCKRGVNQTDADEHLLKPFENIPRVLYDRPIVEPTSYKLPQNFTQTGRIYRLLISHDPNEFKFTVGDKLTLKANRFSGLMDGVWTITDIFKKYYITQDIWVYGIDFEITETLPDTIRVINFENYKEVDAVFKQYISIGTITGNTWKEPYQNPYSDFDDANDYPNMALTMYGTFIRREIEVEHHVYSQYQWLLWRLLNEVNGQKGSLNDIYSPITQKTKLATDLGFFTDMGSGGPNDTGWLPNVNYWDYYKPLTEQGILPTDTEFIYNNAIVKINPELDDIDELVYDSLASGIIWPTPHFKWITDLTIPKDKNVSILESYELLRHKIKEYKPKHTVMESMLNYNLGETSIDSNVTLSIENPPALNIDSYMWLRIVPLSSDFGRWDGGVFDIFTSDEDLQLLPNFSLNTGDEIEPSSGMWWDYFDPNPIVGGIHSDIFYHYYSNGEVKLEISINNDETIIEIDPIMTTDLIVEYDPNEEVLEIDLNTQNLQDLDINTPIDLEEWVNFFGPGYDKSFNPNPENIGDDFPDFCENNIWVDGGFPDSTFSCPEVDGGYPDSTFTEEIDGGTP